MSYKIDPKEVLEYLNELGYTNITAQQLKEFIIDLKKLIKYDSRYKDEQENSIPNSYFAEESGYCECSESTDCSLNRSDNKENQRGVNIPSEKLVKEVPKDKHIALHIYESKPRKNILHEHCIHINEETSKSPSHKLDLVINKERNSTTDEVTESTVRSIRPQSHRDLQSRSSRISSKDKKSKVAFIRPSSAKPSFNKSDPVALYHFYQSEWKKSKIPGQDKREDLRWAIRERMLSGPKVEVKRRPIIRSCSSCR